jgi:hypothetical protein
MNNDNAVLHNVVLVTDGSADGLFDEVRKKHRSAIEESATEAIRHVAFFRYEINPDLSYSDARSIRFESQSWEASIEFITDLMHSAETSAKVHSLMVDTRLDPGAVNVALSQGKTAQIGYVASEESKTEQYLDVLAHTCYQDDLRRCIDERVLHGYYRSNTDPGLGAYASGENVDEFQRNVESLFGEIQWRVQGWNDINSPLRLAFGPDFAGKGNYPWTLFGAREK